MPTAYLTIDDAPSENLPSKLEVLETHDVPALFFCEGRRLADYPEYARQAIEAGYHLGNHAYSHQHASEISVEAFADELERTDALLEDVYDDAGIERPAKLFRFPYGDKGDDRAPQFQQVLEDRGFTSPNADRIGYDWYAADHADDHDWFWTISLEDWSLDSRAELREQVESVTDRLADSAADIVLFHDANNTPDLFAALLELLRERDVEFAEPLSLVNSAPES